MDNQIRLANHHTGETLYLRRVRDRRDIVLEINGNVPPKGEGPPLHAHLGQQEEGTVHAGELTAQVGGRRVTIRAGESAVFPAGVPHRWWNEGVDPISFSGRAVPAGDLDRFLQGMFAVANHGPAGRPSLFYLAHLMYRHRRTQLMTAIPRRVQQVALPAVVFLGWILGKYRGADWPGSPRSCPGAAGVSIPIGG